MQNRLLFFTIILSLSCLNNLIIPYVIYTKKFGLFKRRPPEFIGVNMWGIIMDGILAGLINILTLNLLLEVKLSLNLENIIFAILLGFSFMVVCHIYMAAKKWKIWIMPFPWRWNLAGYWHMISMTIQMSFCAYGFVILAKSPILFTETITQYTLLLIFFLSSLFLLALRLHTKGLKVRRIHISHKPW